MGQPGQRPCPARRCQHRRFCFPSKVPYRVRIRRLVVEDIREGGFVQLPFGQAGLFAQVMGGNTPDVQRQPARYIGRVVPLDVRHMPGTTGIQVVCDQLGDAYDQIVERQGRWKEFGQVLLQMFAAKEQQSGGRRHIISATGRP